MLIDPNDGNSKSNLATTPTDLLAQTRHNLASSRSFSARHALLVLFSRRRLIAIVTGAIVVLTLAAVLFVPPRYRSEAKLMVRLGRGNVSTDPQATNGQSAIAMDGRDKEINSEIELIKSRKLTETIVGQIGANRILGRKTDAGPSAKDVAEAIAKIEDKTTVAAIPESNILSIGFDAADAQLARDVVARLIDAYLDERSRVYREQTDLKFFQSQLDSARRRQASAQRKLRELRDTSGISNPEQQRTLLLTRVDAIQRDIDTASADLAAVANSTGVVNLLRERDIEAQAALHSRVEALTAARKNAQTGLAWIDEIAAKTQTIEQDQALAAASVAKYSQACEQARIDEQMGRDRVGNISIAEPPVLPLRAKGTSRGLLVLAGLCLAATMGLGSAFVADALDHTVRDAEQLHSLGLAQVVSIPHVNDYQEPYYHALNPARRAALARGVARPLDDDQADCDSMLPLRALIRSSANPSAAGTRAAADRAIDETDLRSGQTLVITDERGAEVISVHSAGNWNRPAGPLAVSPSILAAIRGAVDRLLPLGTKPGVARVIGVVAARNDEGASTVAMHLAIALAHRIDTGLNDPSNTNRVLLVDSDLESPTSSLLAGAGSARGLGDWVAMRTGDTERLLELTMPTRQRLLDVLPAGAARERSPLGPRMPAALAAIRQRYRHIVLDLPAVMESDAAAHMAALCDMVVYVCEANELRIESARHALRQLRDVDAKISLAVLNKRRYPVPEWAYRMA